MFESNNSGVVVMDENKIKEEVFSYGVDKSNKSIRWIDLYYKNKKEFFSLLKQSNLSADTVMFFYTEQQEHDKIFENISIEYFRNQKYLELIKKYTLTGASKVNVEKKSKKKNKNQKKKKSGATHKYIPLVENIISKTIQGELKWIELKAVNILENSKRYNCIDTSSGKALSFIIKKDDKNNINYILKIDNALTVSSGLEDLEDAIKATNPEIKKVKFHRKTKEELEYEKKELIQKNKEQQKAEHKQLKRLKKKIEQERIKAVKIEKKRKKKEEKRTQRSLTKQKEITSVSQIGVYDFVIRRTVFKCMHDSHKIENIEATINIIDNKNEERVIRVSAGYCPVCKVYFVMESTYDTLKKKGIPICRIIDERNYKKNCSVNGMILAQESILKQYGYSVGQDEGLSSARRQKILAVLIDKKIMSKSEIISYLDFFISQRTSQAKYKIAISKWEKDREFVEYYRIGEYQQYGVKALERR